MNNFVKNNKASILPVTIIAMFIVMIIAYACIKMFLTQNIIATTDQIKIRTRYAAEGFAEKQKSAIYNLIESQFKNDPNVSITAGTTLSNTGISNLDKNGENFSINFNDALISLNTNINSAPFVSADTMFPDIKLSASSISTMDPKDWLSDVGVKFYKTKGVTNVDVGTLQYNNYMEINNTVYPNIGVRDPRTMMNTNFGVNMGFDGKEYLIFFDVSGSNPTSTSFIPEIAQVILIKEVLNNNVNNTVSTNLNNAFAILRERYPNGRSDNELRIAPYIMKYLIVNNRKGYVITATAKSPRIPATGPVIRIPEMTSTVKIYFDVFMTKLYLRMYPHYEYGGSDGHHMQYYCVNWNAASNSWNTNYTTHNVGTSANWSLIKYRFVPDTTKYINNIKFHIQKWEVVS